MSQLLGEVAYGTTIYITENGTFQPYIIVNQGNPSASLYDNSCDGTWVLRTNIYSNDIWGSEANPQLPTSDIAAVMNNILNVYDNYMLNNYIQQVKIPYYDSDGVIQSGSNGYSCKIFPLSALEVGISSASDIPNDGVKLDYFISGSSSSANAKRVSSYNGSPTTWATRSPETDEFYHIIAIWPDGQSIKVSSTNSFGVRPAMVLSPNLIVNDSNQIVSIKFTVNVPSMAMTGQPIPISWTNINQATNYKLERNTGSGWSTIYTGSTNSYQDTAGNWNSVQYRVSLQVGGVYSKPYGVSSSISVTSASALIISGQNENLGVITEDISYTVTSDTGNTIILSRTVNGTQTTSITVKSGFGYTIPIEDLPTGSGVITIQASVSNGSSMISATRTWEYTKTPIIISNSGGVGQLVQSGQNIWPITLAECIKVPTFFGGTLDKALELIAPVVNPTIIAAGSYTGNGRYGQIYANTLNFSRTPLMVLIYGPETSLTISSTNTNSTAYISGNSATWYSEESAEAQLNSSGVEYTYVAIALTN